MKQRTILRLALSFLILSALPAYVSAQRFEIHPYAGGFFPDGTDVGELRNEGIYGVKGGFFLTKQIEVEGNFGYINHFQFKNTDPESRGILWEASALYHLPVFYRRLQPFVTAGIGGITAVVDEESSGFTNPSGPVFDDNNTFFAFSYGGGVKAMRLWGPVGLRADLRGRTLPNLRGESASWLELTGGLIFNWGER